MKANPVKLLPVLYEATADGEQWSVFLRMLSEQVDAKVSTLISRGEEMQLRKVVQFGADPEAQRIYESYYWTIDAYLAYAQQRGFNYPGATASSQAFISDKELLSTEYCNDFLLKYGMFHHCFSLFGNNGVALANLAMMRSIHEQPFGEPALRILRFMAPHIQQAIRLDEHFTQLRMESKSKTEALDQLALGVVFLDATGQILEANEAATAILAKNDGLLNSKKRLKVSLPSEDRALQAAIFQSCQTGAARGTHAGGALLVSRRPPSKPLQLVVGPACASMPALSSKPSAVVFINDLSARIRPRSGLLKQLYGFTPAESRLACLILDGKSGEEIAELLGISRNTFKTQLKSIFTKANIRRQSELIRLLMLLPQEVRNS